MGIFDPKVEANIPVVQPQVQQSALGGIASWLSDGITSAQKTAATGGPTAGERKDALELSQGVGLQNSLLKVEALRREGRTDEADRAEQRVLANAARDGVDLSSGQNKALYRATTGRDPEFMGISAEERAVEAARATPQFQSAFIGTFASGTEMSAAERENVALAQMARTGANEMMLQNNAIEWDQGRSQAFSGVVSDFNATTLGALNLHTQGGGVVSMDTLNSTQLKWEGTKSQLLASRPVGISDAQWKPIADQIAQTDRTFTTLLEMNKVAGDRGLTAQAMQPIAAALMADTDLTALEKYAGINSLPKLVELGVVPPTEVYATLKAIKVPDIPSSTLSITDASGGVTDPATGKTSLFAPEILGSLDGVVASEALDQAKAITKVNNFTSPEEMVADPAARDSFALLTSKGFAAMTQISETNREFASTASINEVFDGKVVANINALAVVNPAQARTLFLQGEEALNQQHAIAVQAVRNTQKADSPLIWNGETEKLEFQFNSLTRMGIGENQLLELRAAADKHYGGDFMAMVGDTGRKLRVANDMENAYRMVNTGTIQGLIGDAEELMMLAGTVRTLNEKRKIFSDGADALEVEKPTQTTANTLVVADMQDRKEEFSAITGFESVADDAGFLNAVGTASNNLGIDAGDLLKAISFETVGTFSTSIKNPNGSATGLIQFVEKTAKGLGTSTAQLKNMSREEQMAYVEKYLAPYKGKMKNLGDVYMAIHWPAGIGKADSHVMYKEGSDEYAGNKNLDVNGDGTVTRGEALARLNGASGTPTEAGAVLDNVAAGPSVDTTAPAQSSAPSGQPSGDATERLVLGAQGQIASNINTSDQARDRMRADDAPEQPPAGGFEEAAKVASQDKEANAIAKLVSDKLSAKQKRQLKALGYRPEELDFFETKEEAKAALEAGEVEAGQLYVDGAGNVWQVE